MNGGLLKEDDHLHIADCVWVLRLALLYEMQSNLIDQLNTGPYLLILAVKESPLHFLY